MTKTEKYLEGLTIHKVPYNIANTSDFKTNVMGKAADNELFIITDTPTFSLKIGNVTYDGTSNVSANTATQSVSGLMSAADKTKLDGIASGANKTIVDTTLSNTSTNPVQNKVIKAALSSKADNTALDAKADKTALDGKLDKTGGTLTGNLTGKYLTGTWLQTTASVDLSRTPEKVAVLDEVGWVYYRTPAELKSDIGADAVVTTSSDGLMSAADKKKLDGIASGANKTIVDTTLSNTSTNPVQNKVIKAALSSKADNTALDAKADKTALDGKLDKTGGTLTGNLTGKYLTGTWLQTTASVDLSRTPEKVAVLDEVGWVYYRTPAELKSDIGADAVVTTSSDGLMSAADKSKLDGIATGATKITVDTALSSNSTNPVQNKVINSALGKKLNKSGGTLTGAITTKGIKLTSGTDFGSSLPSSLQSNQLFFQTLGSNYILDNVYPVGSIYMSVNSTNPKNLFGGTWEQIQGRFLFGMNSSYPAGSTGGEITHKLTNAEMPAHAHYMASGNAGASDTWTPDAGSYLVDSVTNDQHTWWAQIGMNEAGGSEAHNNMPPYLSVYIWKRTK